MYAVRRLAWVILYGFAIFLSLNRHAHSERFTYHSEIWADRAGYLVYLPAVFCYGLEARRFPAAIDVQTGRGFQLNLTTNKVETKYPYGVALLQAPFWAVAQGLSADKSGFSTTVHKAVDVAAATYFVWGLWLAFSTLRRQFAGTVVVATLALLTLGTNLWYYGLIDTGMSHAYSFFAFSLLMWLLGRVGIPTWATRIGTAGGRREIIAVGATLGLISVLRPLNLVLALPLLFWPARLPAPGWSAQLRGLLHWRVAGLLGLAVAVCWLPQLAYFKYARGAYLVYSYGGESFPYLLAPRLAEVWFAPNNGCFLYGLPLALMLPGLGLLARRSGWWSALAILLFGLASYLYASWWSYSLGCGYGGRGFVDLYPVLVWPLAAVVENVLQYRRWILGVVCGLAVGLNLLISSNYDRCFYGKHDWDWRAYQNLLLVPLRDFGLIS